MLSFTKVLLLSSLALTLGSLRGNRLTREPVGGNRDEHGCLPTAGYSWCDGKQKCLRVFEEPCSVADVTDFTSSSQPSRGGHRDQHGCLPTAGYLWCESKQKCVRLFEESCGVVEAAAPPQKMRGGDRDEHGCLPTAGYVWCESKQNCVRLFEEPCV